MSSPAPKDVSIERAEKICEFARAKVAAGMQDAAFALFAQALQSHVSCEAAMHGLLECGPRISDLGGNSASVKSLRRDVAQVGGTTGDFLDALILTALNPSRKDYALSASERAFRVGVPTAGRFLLERALSLLSSAEKQSSDDYFTLANIAFKQQMFDLAERTAQTAVDLDPGSAEKRSFHKNATAARIIADRGLEKPGTRFVHQLNDPAAQQRLQEKPVSSADELEAMITAARAEYEQKTGEKGKIVRLISLLEKRGQTNDISEATMILSNAFERTNDPSLRQRLADIQLRPLETALKTAQRALSLQPDNAELRADVNDKRKAYLLARSSEFERRAIEYPTEPGIRLELGEMLLQMGRFNEAIPHLQAGRSDMKQRSRAWRLLGTAFTAIAFWDEAALCLEEAFKQADADPSRQLEAKLSLGKALLDLYSKKPEPAYLDRARKMIMDVVVEDFTHPGAVKLRAQLSKYLTAESGV
jgi:tetratricopeptide (TPR) repeat protein